jgi:hypothetical protein
VSPLQQSSTLATYRGVGVPASGVILWLHDAPVRLGDHLLRNGQRVRIDSCNGRTIVGTALDGTQRRVSIPIADAGEWWVADKCPKMGGG